MGFTAYDMLIYLGKWSRLKILLDLLPGTCPCQIGRNCLMFWRFWLTIFLFFYEFKALSASLFPAHFLLYIVFNRFYFYLFVVSAYLKFVGKNMEV